MKTTFFLLIFVGWFSAILPEAQSQPIIANHEHISLNEIPITWIETVKSDLRIWYGHTSHGSQITSGITNIETNIGEPYTFNASGSGGQLSYQELNGYDLGHNGDLYWEYLTRQQLDDPANDRNVVIWSWCGGVSDNTPAGIDIYLDAMNQLELDYPDVQFVYMTGHLDIWSDANLKARNQQIRDYCAENDKILFDFADIESYDPDGNFYEYANDNCDYYEGPGWGFLGNWADAYCADNPDSEYCWDCYCAHSKPANCNMKGRAFWWMLAKMAGWGAEQDVYYVDKNHPDAGDDNPGSEDFPWLTIQHALDVSQAGDSIIIREGNYHENLVTQNDGSVQNGFIIFAGHPGEEISIDGDGYAENTGLRIENNFLKFYNLSVQNWSSTGIWMTGAADVQIQNCEVAECVYGIGISGGAHDFVFKDVEVHHFDLYGFDASPSGEDFCYNGTFINCLAHSGRDPQQNVDGFALGHGDQHGFVFQNCVTYGVYDGFDISSSNTSLEACLAYDCWNTCYKLWQDQVELVNCIGHDGEISVVQIAWNDQPSETTFRNCTFSNAGVYTLWVANSNDILNMHNCIISGGENIGLCFEESSVQNYHGNNNLFQNNNSDRLIYVGGAAEFSLEEFDNGDWAAFSGEDGNSLSAISLSDIYQNPIGEDFHLSAGSPAIDAADPTHSPDFDFDGNPRPYGTAPDIGAYESLQDLPSYEVSPASLDFGTVYAGDSVSAPLLITNTGPVPVIIDSITLDSDVFEISGIAFPVEITDQQEVTVIFDPAIAGSWNAELVIFSDQSFNLVVPVSGSAIQEPTGGFHVSGEVFGNWQIYDSIFVDGDLIVPNGETLIIEPVDGGTDIVFTGHYQFNVYGRLEMLGNVQDSIRLWSLNKPEGWGGLRFYDLNYNDMDSSRITFCDFRYANANGPDWDSYGGGIFIYESSPVRIIDSKISRNHADDSGGGIHIRYSLPVLQRLEISNNTAVFGGGVMLWGSYPEISKTLIFGNEADYGGGICINESSPVMDHITMSKNSASLGGGIYQQDWSYPEFSNSIIYGNAAENIHILPNGGQIIAEYSNVGGTATLPGNGNINADPLFSDPENVDFRLSWVNFPEEDETKSPCINSGDPAFPYDQDGSVTEMGAIGFEAQIQTLVIPSGWSGISTFVDPFQTDLEFMFENFMEQLVIVKNMNGVFWPQESINTLGDWDYSSGYIIKLYDEVEVNVPGYPVADKSKWLNTGWNLLPVSCSCGVSCQEIMDQLGDDLVIIKEVAGNRVCWPEFGIHTLYTMDAGKSYFVLMINEGFFSFPDCE